MDRATIKSLATSMLQNRSAVAPAQIDAVLDSVYSHLLVDEIASLARRDALVIITANGTAEYALGDLYRGLDADYAYLDDGNRVPLYTAREAWLQLGTAVGSAPQRLLVFYNDPDWKVLVAPTPTGVININIPVTLYRGNMLNEGTPNENEAWACIYGTVMQLALVSGLDDIVTAAQAGLKTFVGQLKAQVASDRQTPSQLPPRRDF